MYVCVLIASFSWVQMYMYLYPSLKVCPLSLSLLPSINSHRLFSDDAMMLLEWSSVSHLSQLEISIKRERGGGRSLLMEWSRFLVSFSVVCPRSSSSREWSGISPPSWQTLFPSLVDRDWDWETKEREREMALLGLEIVCVRLYRLVVGRCEGVVDTETRRSVSLFPLWLQSSRRMRRCARKNSSLSPLFPLILCFFSSWVGCGFGKNVREEFQY